jgi:hypothetical protein
MTFGRLPWVPSFVGLPAVFWVDLIPVAGFGFTLTARGAALSVAARKLVDRRCALAGEFTSPTPTRTESTATRRFRARQATDEAAFIVLGATLEAKAPSEHVRGCDDGGACNGVGACAGTAARSESSTPGNAFDMRPRLRTGCDDPMMDRKLTKEVGKIVLSTQVWQFPPPKDVLAIPLRRLHSIPSQSWLRTP